MNSYEERKKPLTKGSRVWQARDDLESVLGGSKTLFRCHVAADMNTCGVFFQQGRQGGEGSGRGSEGHRANSPNSQVSTQNTGLRRPPKCSAVGHMDMGK